MIIEAILNVFQGALTGLLSLLPNLPDLPDGITDAVDGIVDSIMGVIGVMAYLYTPPLLTIAFVILVAVINFDSIYKFVLWVYHKIRT